MDTTTHTTNAVEFADYRAKALEKLDAEDKSFKGNQYTQVFRPHILKALKGFCSESVLFAEVVFKTKRTLSECCAAVDDGVKEAISDLEAYRRAVRFYFPNSEVEFKMNVQITGEAPTQEEMDKPATVKVVTDIQKPAPASMKPVSVKPKPVVKPESKKSKPDVKKDDQFMQLSLWG